MNQDPVYIQCEHCPVSSSRWEVLGRLGDGRIAVEDIDASLSAHVLRVHPATVEPPWVLDEDYLVMSLGDTVEDDLMVSQFQHGASSSGSLNQSSEKA